MAAIQDTAGIFTGAMLDAFNQMEVVVARDGDVAYAQQEMRAAMLKVIDNQQLGTANKTGQALKHRDR